MSSSSTTTTTSTRRHVCDCPGCPNPGTHRCSRCSSAYYCSVGHQREHWAIHKPECTSEGREALAELAKRLAESPEAPKHKDLCDFCFFAKRGYACTNYCCGKCCCALGYREACPQHDPHKAAFKKQKEEDMDDNDHMVMVDPITGQRYRQKFGF